jgi:hypothetical protein
LTLTFILFPVAVATGRLALAASALIGIAAIASLVSAPTREIADQSPSQVYESLPGAYARPVLHVVLRTVPFILVGIFRPQF